MMDKRLKKIWGIGALGFGLLIAFVLWPSLRGLSSVPSLGRESDSEMVSKVFQKIEKVQTYFIEEKLKDALSLSENQTTQLIAILKASNAKRSDVIRKKVKIVDQLERGELHGEALSVALKQVEDLDHQFYALQQARQDELRQVLNDEQVAKFFVLRRQFVRKVIDVLKPIL